MFRKRKRNTCLVLNKKVKTKTLIRFLREVCKEKRVSLRVRRIPGDINGLCYTSGRLIDVNKNIREKAEIARTVFHELAHAECIKKGKYKKFHTIPLPPSATFYYENKIEKIAKRNWDKSGMRKVFGQYEFYYSIKDKKDVLEWIRKDN